MSLEPSFNFIDDLDSTNPAAGDNVSEGDDHIRGVKNAIKGSFPNLGSAAVTSTAAELNVMDGVSAFRDEDDMASNSATSIASQQSIKAYVDNRSTNTTVVNLGDWDMDADMTQIVAHGLTLANIRTITVTIRNDADNTYFNLFSADGVTVSANATNVNIVRTTGDTFDNTAFDTATSFNRGWITIEYV